MAASKSSGGHPWLKRIVIALIAAVAASVVARRKALAPAPQFDLQLSARPEPPAPPAPQPRPETAPPVRLVTAASPSPAETPNSTPDEPPAAASDARAAGGASPEADTATDAETDGEASIQANAEAEVEADIEADTGAGSEARVEAEAEADIEEDTKAATEAATEAASGSDSETTDGVAIEELDDLEEDEAESDAGLPVADDPVSAALNSGAGYLRMNGNDRSCPEAFPIKGNASSHIYHRPGESSYEATIPEICFADEGVAASMGYRPRKH